jgi:hypothetical protein
MTFEQIEISKKELLKKVNNLQDIKKDKFSNIDISMAMSDEEKELTKEIAKIWGEINQLVILKNKLKKSFVL